MSFIGFSVFFSASCEKMPMEDIEPMEPNDTLKVMSFNIKVGNFEEGENSWNSRKSGVKEMILQQMPDFFGLQEATFTQVVNMNKWLSDYSYYGLGRDNGDASGEIMAIFYNEKRFEVLDKGTFWLSETPEVVSFGWDAKCRRTATWCLMEEKSTSKRFYYLNTHLDNSGALARTKGVELICERLHEMNVQNYPVIITGDFNSNPASEVLNPIREKYLDARQTALISDDEISFNGWGKSSKIIDYIFYSDFEALEFHTVNDSFAGIEYISDHYPITSTMVLL